MLSMNRESSAAPSTALNVALLQFNPVVGDLVGNARQIIDQARLAYAKGARLVVTPEMALCGYPPAQVSRSSLVILLLY